MARLRRRTRSLFFPLPVHTYSHMYVYTHPNNDGDNNYLFVLFPAGMYKLSIHAALVHLVTMHCSDVHVHTRMMCGLVTMA